MCRTLWIRERTWAFVPREVGALKGCEQRRGGTWDLTHSCSKVPSGYYREGGQWGVEGRCWGTLAEVTVLVQAGNNGSQTGSEEHMETDGQIHTKLKREP